MQKGPKARTLGVPEPHSLRLGTRSDIGGWGNRTRQLNTERQGHRGMGVPNGWPYDQMLERARRHTPLCSKQKSVARPTCRAFTKKMFHLLATLGCVSDLGGHSLAIPS